MSISSSTRKAGPYSCNGSTVAFPFSFKVFQTSDVRVVLTDASGVESDLVVGTNYTVALNADQDANPGGTVTTTATYATGNKITLASQVQNLQPVTLTNQGGFYPKVINAALDRLTILAQQNAEQIGRSVKVPISSSVTPDSLIAQLTADAATAAAAAGEASASASSASASASAAAASAAALPNATGSANTLPVVNPSGNGWDMKTAAQARSFLGLGSLALANAERGLFYKADSASVVFTKTGAGAMSIKAGTVVEVNGSALSFSAATAITMPALTAGTDYAIYACADGTIRADASFTAPTGYTTTNSRKIGGFHYAPGGNAAAQAGGDTAPAINAYSLWDLKFRPACPDPRGMTLVADSFWSDIYLLGVDHLTNGTSKYNVTTAKGSIPPKIPIKFGGNGSTAYSTLNWWEANEVLQSWGKRSPTYDEFAALAYGTTEATSSGGTDVPTTGVTGTGATNAWNKFTSRWGVIQSTGCLYIWGGEFGGGASGAAWAANTGGRGSTYQMENAVVFGGSYVNPIEPGSRCANWVFSPTYSNSTIGARGVASHLIID